MYSNQVAIQPSLFVKSWKYFLRRVSCFYSSAFPLTPPYAFHFSIKLIARELSFPKISFRPEKGRAQPWQSIYAALKPHPGWRVRLISSTTSNLFIFKRDDDQKAENRRNPNFLCFNLTFSPSPEPHESGAQKSTEALSVLSGNLLFFFARCESINIESWMEK